jgi:iturin family lipopeptide synthetase B
MKPLNKKNIRDIFALTPMQEGILFHYLKDPGKEYYFQQLSLEISGKINKKRFEKAWNFVAAANEMLRAVFQWEKLENPIQIILKKHKIQPIYHDLSDKTGNQAKKHLEEIKTRDKKVKFDLTSVPFRITLCKLGSQTHIIIISYHHILCDGWSTGIILKEFFYTYNTLLKKPNLNQPIKSKFKDFVTFIKKQDEKEQERYWTNYLAGLETHTTLSIKQKTHHVIEGNDFKSYSFTLEAEIKNQLEELAKKNKVTLAALLYSVWGMLLQKYNNTDDVILGTTVSGRSAKIKGIEEIVGLFINTIPLRVHTCPRQKITHVLSRVNNALQMREEFAGTSLVNIKQYSPLAGGSETLFDTIISIENYPLDHWLTLKQEPGKDLLSVNSYSIVERTHYDLTIEIIPFDGIAIDMIYNPSLLDENLIENLSRHFATAVDFILENPNEEAAGIEIISPREKDKILYEFNNTYNDNPNGKTLQQLFEKQAAKTPAKSPWWGSTKHTKSTKKITICPIRPICPIKN